MNYEIEESDLEQPLHLKDGHLGSLNFTKAMLQEDSQSSQNMSDPLKHGPQLENLVIKRSITHNSLNQPPVCIKTYHTPLLLKIGFFLVNTFVFFLQNIIFFASTDFGTFSNNDSGNQGCENNAFSNFVFLLVFAEIAPFYAFLVANIVIFGVERQNVPQVYEFRYNKQQSMVKFIQQNGTTHKVLLMTADILLGLYALCASVMMAGDMGGIQNCKAQHKTIYKLLTAIIFFGFFALFRLIYFIFPHWAGIKFYRRKQTADLDSQKVIQKDIPIYQYVIDSYINTNRTEFYECQMCKKNFYMRERVAQMPCGGQHIFHKECVNTWFNLQHHLNCPVCLEFILGKKKKQYQ